MKVKTLKAQVINGSVWPAQATVDVPARQAQELIAAGRVAEIQEVQSGSAISPAPLAYPKEKKKA